MPDKSDARRMTLDPSRFLEIETWLHAALQDAGADDQMWQALHDLLAAYEAQQRMIAAMREFVARGTPYDEQVEITDHWLTLLVREGIANETKV